MAKENATFVKAIVFIATGHFLLLEKTKKKKHRTDYKKYFLGSRICTDIF